MCEIRAFYRRFFCVKPICVLALCYIVSSCFNVNELCFCFDLKEPSKNPGDIVKGQINKEEK